MITTNWLCKPVSREALITRWRQMLKAWLQPVLAYWDKWRREQRQAAVGEETLRRQALQSLRERWLRHRLHERLAQRRH